MGNPACRLTAVGYGKACTFADLNSVRVVCDGYSHTVKAKVYSVVFAHPCTVKRYSLLKIIAACLRDLVKAADCRPSGRAAVPGIGAIAVAADTVAVM